MGIDSEAATEGEPMPEAIDTLLSQKGKEYCRGYSKNEECAKGYEFSLYVAHEDFLDICYDIDETL